MTPEQIKQAAKDFTEVPLAGTGRRCGVRWAPWMGDWFNSWSPRNDNSNAEGPWVHWVNLAIAILQDPMTEIVRPQACRAVAGLAVVHDADEQRLSAEALAERFRTVTP